MAHGTMHTASALRIIGECLDMFRQSRNKVWRDHESQVQASQAEGKLAAAADFLTSDITQLGDVLNACYHIVRFIDKQDDWNDLPEEWLERLWSLAREARYQIGRAAEGLECKLTEPTPTGWEAV